MPDAPAFVYLPAMSHRAHRVLAPSTVLTLLFACTPAHPRVQGVFIWSS